MQRLSSKWRLGIATRHLAWVALGFFGMLLALAVVLARVGAARLIDAARWYGTLTASDQTVRWDGGIVLDHAKFIPHGANESAALEADLVTIDTGGTLGLMRLALRRTSADRLARRRKELEASGALEVDDAPAVLPPMGRLAIDAENVTVGPNAAFARWIPWLDPNSGVLFATLGCNEAVGLGRAVARRAGDSGRFDVELRMRQQREATLVSARLGFGGISTAKWEGSFLPASSQGLLAGDWRQWQMTRQQWTLQDREFVRARNRECARRLALPRPQFVARHALAVKRQLATWKVALPAPLEYAYRQHASVGGEIIFVSRPRQPVRLGEYQLMSRSQRIGALDGQVTMAGRRLPLLLEFLPEPISAIAAAATPPAIKDSPAIARIATAPGERITPPAVASVALPKPGIATSVKPHALSSPAADVAPRKPVAIARTTSSVTASPIGTKQTPLPTAPVVAISPVAPSSDSALPSQGNYRGLMGQRVTITTTFGTVRTGKITIANNVAVTIEMQTSNGPIQLRIPAEQIVRVRSAPL